MGSAAGLRCRRKGKPCVVFYQGMGEKKGLVHSRGGGKTKTQDRRRQKRGGLLISVFCCGKVELYFVRGGREWAATFLF